ncbi:MAG: urea ABC transporter permease subunit UrtB [Deltaproteobacteria bacterium]|jgi:urea transport system permease protein|nr:urea ABC transporter permease subunit UrtB [Deltaproteobacteria bacterium]
MRFSLSINPRAGAWVSRARLAALLALVFCALAGVARAQAPAASPLAPEVRESLLDPKVNARDRAIALLAEDLSEESARILTFLKNGDLFFDAETRKLYLRVGEKSFVTLSGEEYGGSAPLKKSAVNNRQRQKIQSALNARSLQSPDPQARREASRALIASGEMELETLQALIEAEDDSEARENLRAARAAAVLKDPQAAEGDILSALALFQERPAPEARELIRVKAESPDAREAQAARKALASLEARAQRLAFFETLFFGLSLGSVLVLIAIGLAITFGVMGVINMAHGEMAMLGAYAVWFLQELMPDRPLAALLLAIPLAFVGAGLVGALIERGVIRFLYQRPLETLLATFGISLILRQAALLFISANNRPIVTPAFFGGQWRIADGFAVSVGRVSIIVFCLAVFFALVALLRYTRLGLETRAVTQNREIARAMGVKAARVDALTFALGSGVAGLAGVALSLIANVGPNMGQGYIVDSFMVVVFGGVGNLWGSLAGGLVIGLANKFMEPAYGAILAKILIMVGIIFFIQRRPSGLFPPRGRAARG